MLREDRYEKQSEGTSIFVTGLGVVVAIIFSIGAMIGAMITMYAPDRQPQSRDRHAARTGFSRRSILASFLLEALALALSGGLFGIAMSLGLGTVRFSMMNFASWSEIVFFVLADPGILLTALLFAGMMGLFGGLFPAVRATRISPLSAMRDQEARLQREAKPRRWGINSRRLSSVVGSLTRRVPLGSYW